MDPARDLGRILILLGAIFVFFGAILYFGARLPWRLGRFPGDIIHRGEHSTFYFPMVTCLILSLGLSLLIWLFGHLRK
jgi:Kef-type K+ transport system membrane component KefB